MVAEHDGAGQPAVPDDQLGVPPAGRVGERDHLVGVHCGLAHRGEVDAGRLQAGDRGHRAVPRGRTGTGDEVGDHVRLRPRGRDQSRHVARVLRAVADRVDVRIACAQPVVHDDAAVHGKAGRACQPHLRAHTAGDHQQVGVDRRAVGQVQRVTGRRYGHGVHAFL